MKILVTGASGLLGMQLVNKLRQDHNIIALLKNNPSNQIEESKTLRVLKCDLSSLETQDLPKDIDFIYYLAQSNQYKDFPGGANDMFNLNISSPFKLINWAINNKVKGFVFASSGGVYKTPNEPVKEVFQINANIPNGFYLDSKLSSEILLRNFSSFFDTFIIARPFFIYGKNQKKTMLIPRLIDSVKNKKEIFFSKNGGIKINPINVLDAAYAFEKMLDLKGEHIINIAGDEVVSLKKLVKQIGKLCSIKPEFKTLDHIQNDLVADNQKMKELLYVPNIKLSEGLKVMID